jgi:hypothetical protein
MKMPIVALLALLTCLLTCLAPPLCPAARAADAPAGAAVILADWQGPQQLPRRFRNHCAVDTFSHRPYCADHCGFDNQFYFCSHESFGCCRIGFGYCDWSGLLRCHP